MRSVISYNKPVSRPLRKRHLWRLGKKARRSLGIAYFGYAQYRDCAEILKHILR